MPWIRRKRLRALEFATSLLVCAYDEGKASGGSIDWEVLDDAHAAARRALGLPETDEEE